MVAPFARALSLLAAFTSQDDWLGTGELAARTALPSSSVSRLARSLVLLGYLLHSTTRRAYRLAAPVLALGYGAIANSDVQRTARAFWTNSPTDNRARMLSLVLVPGPWISPPPAKPGEEPDPADDAEACVDVI